ncbi:MAG: hypothetical protein CMI52_01845 [Parcubacteria group bacterium]|nr:hypothetical protein [Parcubacteria group bacterium]
MTPLYIIIGVVVVLLLWLLLTYNKLVRLKTRSDEAWSDIDVQLKRRYDLIPNLMEAVKGYMKHESETLEAVVKARQQAVQIHDKSGAALADMAVAESALAGALKNLFALSESYPDLKASQNFLQLQDEISDTENKIQAARRFYNGNVRDFNIAIKSFPTNTIAGAFNFKAFEFFEVGDVKERENVKVEF